MAYEIHDTAHVVKRVKERGFTLQQAVETVNDPAGIVKTPPRRGNHGGMIWLFSRAFAARVLIIVAEIKNHECWIITGYWA